MKLCFSTLGCPDWSFDEIFAVTRDFGFDGIEIRGIAEKLYAPDCTVFNDNNIEKTKSRLEKGKVIIPIITSGAILGANENTENNLKEARDYIDLARRLGVKYIRVLVSPNPQPENYDKDLFIKQYKEVCEYGSSAGVTPLVETNGPFCNTELLAEIMSEVECGGVLWDIHHPFRFAGEGISDSYNNLKPYIKHVHVKDSLNENGVIRYKMMGSGDIPTKEAVALLKNGGYDGFISLEWVKRWQPDLEDAGVVFVNYKNYMNSIR